MKRNGYVKVVDLAQQLDVSAAMVRKAELGLVDMSMFPMLSHANAVLDEGKDAQLPWEAFTFDQTK